jgi:hypothetical protein
VGHPTASRRKRPKSVVFGSAMGSMGYRSRRARGGVPRPAMRRLFDSPGQELSLEIPGAVYQDRARPVAANISALRADRGLSAIFSANSRACMSRFHDPAPTGVEGGERYRRRRPCLDDSAWRFPWIGERTRFRSGTSRPTKSCGCPSSGGCGRNRGLPCWSREGRSRPDRRR